MESNGKGVSIDGVPLPYEAGEIDFGKPGTNGQHSFYQLIHQGSDYSMFGVVKSQQPVYVKGELVSHHDELMSNFFAQPDALSYGKTPEQLLEENVPHHLITHKTFSVNKELSEKNRERAKKKISTYRGILKFSKVHQKDLVKITKNSRIVWKKHEGPRQPFNTKDCGYYVLPLYALDCTK
ncbi:Glucose-6-phosphate isomerase, cytosolic 2B [Orobanche hederae]